MVIETVRGDKRYKDKRNKTNLFFETFLSFVLLCLFVCLFVHEPLVGY